MKLYAQLNFGGNCEDAFRYYEAHLGGKITMMMHQGDVPSPGQNPAANPSAILHARINIGETELLGNDVPPEIFKPMRSTYLLLSFDSSEEAERVHAVLSDGGDVLMAMGENFFAFRFSMLRDQFGVLWTIIHQRPM